MKKTSPAHPAPLSVLLLALSLAGCFGGEDGDKGSPVGPGGASGKKIAPGTYVGDYRPYDSTHSLESEFTLGADGAFRTFLIAENQPFLDLKGSWFQQDSNLHFTGVTEAYGDGGFFDSGTTVEGDTNLVREITDSSFIRKEWTPLRVKPYWITYKKKSFAPIKPGNYLFQTEFVSDSATRIGRIRIEMDGTGVLYRYSLDSLEIVQEKAVWFQQGSILGNRNYEYRQFDTTTQSFGAWETIPWSWLKRTSEVSDTAFWIWAPPESFLEMGAWEIYRKVP